MNELSKELIYANKKIETLEKNKAKLEKEKLITQLEQMKSVENIVTKQSIPVYMTGDLRNFYL